MESEFESFIRHYAKQEEELFIIPVNIKSGEYFPIEKLESIAERHGILKVYFEMRENGRAQEKDGEEGYSSLEELEQEIIRSWKLLKNPERFIRSFSQLKEFSLEGKQEELFHLFDEILEEDEDAD